MGVKATAASGMTVACFEHGHLDLKKTPCIDMAFFA